MPRVTSSEHYRRHRFLQMLWREPGLDRLFSLLDTPAQWQLHDYYQPDQDLDEVEFNQLRRAVDRKDPARRHVVGRHFRLLEESFVAASRAFGADQDQMQSAIAAATVAKQPPGVRRFRQSETSHRKVQITTIAEPLDTRKVARGFLSLAEYQMTHSLGEEARKSPEL